MAAETTPMTFHIPIELKERLQRIAERKDRSLTKQMVAMLKVQAEVEERSGAHTS